MAPVEAECVCGGSPVAKSSPKNSQHSLNDSNGALEAPPSHSDDTESQDAQLPSHVARLTRKSVHLIEEVRNIACAKGEQVQVPAARRPLRASGAQGAGASGRDALAAGPHLDT